MYNSNYKERRLEGMSLPRYRSADPAQASYSAQPAARSGQASYSAQPARPAQVAARSAQTARPARTSQKHATGTDVRIRDTLDRLFSNILLECPCQSKSFIATPVRIYSPEECLLSCW